MWQKEQQQEQGRVAASSGHPATLHQELTLIGVWTPRAEQVESTRPSPQINDQEKGSEQINVESSKTFVELI